MLADDFEDDDPKTEPRKDIGRSVAGRIAVKWCCARGLATRILRREACVRGEMKDERRMDMNEKRELRPGG